MIALDPKIKLTPHFTVGELACPCCGACEVDPRMIERLEAARLIYGKPITIASGYRCAQHNKEVGGSILSTHVTGHAVDPLRPIGGEKLIDMIRAFLGAGFHGFGMGAGKLHFDDDPGPGPRSWMYGK